MNHRLLKAFNPNLFLTTTKTSYAMELVKCQPKMIWFCDWRFKTKVMIVCDLFFRKPISIVWYVALLQPDRAC